jgi:hypothetical protein
MRAEASPDTGTPDVRRSAEASLDAGAQDGSADVSLVETKDASSLEATSGGDSGPLEIVYDPPAGTYPYFPTSPFLEKIPNPPTVNPSSAAWVADMNTLGAFGFGTFNVTTDPSLNYGFPIYIDHDGTNTPVTIHCTVQYGGIDCPVEGLTVNIDTRMVPQSGGCRTASCDQDFHLGLIDTAAGYEYDFWQARWPPSNGVLTVSRGGKCLLSGNGFTDPEYGGPSWNAGCVADASGTPLSMGPVRAKDLLAAVAAGGTSSLPMALNYAFACNGKVSQLPAPFLGSGDGTCDGYAPEGSRLYLAMHDADINALGLPAITSVMLRTMDEDHFGAIVVDTDGCNCNQIQFNIESGNTLAAWGLPDPWMAQFIPEAQAEGLPGAAAPSNGAYSVKLPIPDSIAQYVTFL